MFPPTKSYAVRVLRFAAVGLVGYVVDFTVFNLLRYAGDPGILEDKPLTAKVISVTVATFVTYVGNRHWTWWDRHRMSVRREYTLFFFLNGIGMVIALVCLAFSHYVLDLRSPLADNVSANVIGLGLGTVFRFWAYPRFVFRQQGSTSVGVEGPPPADGDGFHDSEASQRPRR